MNSKTPAAKLSAVLILIWTLACFHAEAASKINVVVSTSILQSAVRDIGGGHVSVSVLIAPGSCPGHYDICPQDIRKLSSSKLVLTHGYESFVDNIVRSMGRNKPKLIRVSVSGNWMVPNVYTRGAEQVASVLCKADPEHATDYRASLSSLKVRVWKLAGQVRGQSKSAGAPRTAVLCSNQQEESVKWMGFKVVGTYARAEEFTPAKLHRLTTDARNKSVRLVIDNLQSGPTAGKELAKDIGARHVALSNFPGGFAGTQTWSKCLRDNANRLIRGIAKR
jgi:ABC-type Zn uptake system ZnuABC Zn-binding protein ZnuA